jgi:hypothetical protein
MSYSVNRSSHPRHGSVVSIERAVNGSHPTPYRAVNAACKERRLWKESGEKKVRILVDEQVLSPKQAEHWAHEEYQSLPKCDWCAKVLDENAYQHRLSERFFCSQECTDKDYMEKIEIQKDEEEIDYL